MTQKWTQKEMPNLSGRVVVITGANSGLGFECAKTLAAKGATVVMTARNLQKGEAARQGILQEQPSAALDLMALDVGDLSSIRAFAAAFKEKYDRLDILLNNAGVMAIPRQETPDGFEMQLGVNHLGHFALTGLLLDVITQTPNARIHNVSSSANYTGSINFEDLMGRQNYSRWAAYGQSKLANIFFTFELQKRLTAAGHDTIANVSHPGIVIGNLQANSVQQSGTGFEGILYRVIEPILAQDITMGVLPMLYGMTAEDAKGGVFYGPRTFNIRGYPAEKQANKAAYNAEALKRFWEVSEQLTGVKFNF
ncbi:MAG: SDR family oxidoreductase [Caldilineaceae bacterium]|nr:SDR family oxidoreductase [Caldilineaceae bacterium]